MRRPAPLNGFPPIGGQSSEGFPFDRGGKPSFKGLGDSSGEAGLGVGVSAQENGQANGIFEIRGVEEADERLGDGALTTDIEAVVLPNFSCAPMPPISTRRIGTPV